jgi:hypothetical protein
MLVLLTEGLDRFTSAAELFSCAGLAPVIRLVEILTRD